MSDNDEVIEIEPLSVELEEVESTQETMERLIANPPTPATIESELSTLISTNYGSTPTEYYQDIRMFETHVEFTTNNVKKTITLADFKKTLDDQLKDTTPISNLALPYNTFAIGQNSSELTLSCYYPACVKEVKYLPRGGTKEEKFQIPIPNVLISHKLKGDLKGWKHQGVKYFATNKTVTQLPENKSYFSAVETRAGIYNTPFPNFYDNGTMCFGNNNMPVQFNNNLRALDYYYQILFVAPFNDDLGLRLNSRSGVYGVLDWFKKLSELKEFPYDKLQGYTAN